MVGVKGRRGLSGGGGTLPVLDMRSKDMCTLCNNTTISGRVKRAGNLLEIYDRLER